MPTPTLIPMTTNANRRPLFRTDYSLHLRELEHPPLSVSPCSNIDGMTSALRTANTGSSRAVWEQPGSAPRQPHPLSRSGSPSSFASCMEGGVAHETYSQVLQHSGPQAEQHLRSAAALFASALEHQPESTWAALKRAGTLLHLSRHCHYDEEAAVLLESRELLRRLGEADGAKEGLAAVCGRLSDLEPGSRYATEALEALEDVAADRMDMASALSKEEFEKDTPALADTFLSLANAAAKVSSLADDLDTSDMYAELAERSLEQAANMASLAVAANTEAAAALVARVQLGSAAIVASRLKHLAQMGIGLNDVEDDWRFLLADMVELASGARELAARLRGSKGATAAGTAYQAVKQLADTRVMFAALLRARNGTQEILSPLTPHSDLGLGSTPTLASRGSWSSASGSLDSPPILEETEAEVEAAASGELPNPPQSPSLPDSPISPPKGKQRAPPPPPLKLHRTPMTTQAVQVFSSRRTSPITPLTPLLPSPLNPARRASDSGAQRPSLTRGPSLSRPRRATVNSFSPTQPPQPDAHAAWQHLASAVKGYKLALSLLSASDQRDPVRKSTLLLSISRACLDRAELAGALNHAITHHAPPTPRTDPRSGIRTTGAAALLATAEVYSTWAAREVGWSNVLVTSERGNRLGARADEAGLAAVLTTLKVWGVRERGTDEAGEVWGRLEAMGVRAVDVERTRRRLM